MPKPRGEDDPKMTGFPEHGDPAPDDAALPPDPEEEEDEPEPEPKEDPELADLKKQVAALAAQNVQLSTKLERAIAPEPKPDTAKPIETDWDNLLFTKPKEAVAQIKRETREEVQREIRAEYQKDQGTRKFWTDFYTANPDLKEDGDLVELVMSGNMSHLANIPVTEAIKKLGDLTRDRILRYAGGKPRGGGKKALVEGNNPPGLKPPAREKADVTSLSDVIKARRARRQKANAA